MSDKYGDSVSSFADAIEMISLESYDEPSECNLAAGDGSQIKSQSAEENLKTDEENSMGDHADLEVKPSTGSTFSSSELEQRWKFRLQKLAEFENIQSERAKSAGAKGDEKKQKQQTWHEFWQNVQQDTSQGSNQ